MMRFSRPLSQQVCGPCNILLAAAVLALLAASSLTRTALASDRSLHFHAVSHGSGRVMAPANARGKSARHAAAEGDTRHSTAKTPKSSAHKSKAGPEAKLSPTVKAHGKASRRRHREPEIVDDPVSVHRAKAKPLSRKAAARERLLAKEQDAPSRSGGRARRGHAEYAEAGSRNQKSSRWAKGDAYRSYAPRFAEAPRSIVLAGSTPAAHGSAAPIQKAAQPSASSPSASSQFAAAYRQGQSEPDDDGDVSSLQATDPAKQFPRSIVVRSPSVNEAVVSATALAMKSPATPPSRVVTGFGAEVAAAPVSAVSRDTTTRAVREQQEMDIADDTESQKLADTSPRALAEDAMQPRVLPLYTRNGRLMMPAPLKGSREILVHQNTMADRDGLERIQNDRELNRLRQERSLVSFPESASLRVNYGLPENRRYARPWTVRFAADAARAFYAQFGVALQVNSAVRTVAYQLRLQRVNGNAAATRGDGASPHLTGQAIDLAKRGMSSDEIAWMRTYLLPLMDAGKIDVEEEFQQACFHISVYRAYAPAPRKQAVPKMQVAQLRAEPKSVRSVDAPALSPDTANDQ